MKKIDEKKQMKKIDEKITQNFVAKFCRKILSQNFVGLEKKDQNKRTKIKVKNQYPFCRFRKNHSGPMDLNSGPMDESNVVPNLKKGDLKKGDLRNFTLVTLVSPL